MSASQTLRDQMYALVEEWEKGGGLQKTFCDNCGITVHKFQYWYKRYKEVKCSSAGNDPLFIRVGLQASQAYEHSGGRAEVIYPNGIRILLHQEISAHFLKSLI